MYLWIKTNTSSLSICLNCEKITVLFIDFYLRFFLIINNHHGLNSKRGFLFTQMDVNVLFKKKTKYGLKIRFLLINKKITTTITKNFL